MENKPQTFKEFVGEFIKGKTCNVETLDLLREIWEDERLGTERRATPATPTKGSGKANEDGIRHQQRRHLPPTYKMANPYSRIVFQHPQEQSPKVSTVPFLLGQRDAPRNDHGLGNQGRSVRHLGVPKLERSLPANPMGERPRVLKPVPYVRPRAAESNPGARRQETSVSRNTENVNKRLKVLADLAIRDRAEEEQPLEVVDTLELDDDDSDYTIVD